MPLSQPGVARAVIGSALYLAVAALIGLGLGALLRSTAGGIAALFGLLFAVQIVAGFLPGSWADDVGKYMPATAGQAVTLVHPDPARRCRRGPGSACSACTQPSCWASPPSGCGAATCNPPPHPARPGQAHRSPQSRGKRLTRAGRRFVCAKGCTGSRFGTLSPPGGRASGCGASSVAASPRWIALVTFVCMFESAGLLDGLNEEQRQAAVHPGGPLLILAGAGTGKTRTLVARAAWLREQGMQPGRILLLTFTRRAADDMLSRATARARTASGRITGGTFHAIAHRIIRQHAEAFSLPPEFTVIDPADMADLLDARRADHGLAGTQRRAPRAPVCADIYTRCVNTQMTVADVVRRGFPWCAEYTGQLAELFRGYVAHKRSHAPGRLR